jgi:hypothetical protein
MMRRGIWAIAAAFIAAPFLVQAQDASQRPAPRPESVGQAADLRNGVPAPAQSAANALAQARPKILRPMPRPNLVPASAAVAALAAGKGRVARSPVPKARPATLAVAAVQVAPSPAPEPAAAAPKPVRPAQNQPRNGSVCGERTIRGEPIAPITSKTQGCGVAEPVRVTEVSGVGLSQAITVECGTAVALKDWIDRAMRPAFGKRDVVQLRIAAHYVCRGRNNKRGARVSEHGKGKAVDISGFVFSDGTEWSILRDYNKQIRTAHKGACGIFGTTLGPGSDGFHEDHLHFDTARYRSGPYCR